jgi:hypothetical protein
MAIELGVGLAAGIDQAVGAARSTAEMGVTGRERNHRRTPSGGKPGMDSIGSAVVADTGCGGGRNLGQEVVADARAVEGADVPGSDKFVTRSAKGS